LFSLAQAKVMDECIPLAIYDNDDLVGFTMYCMDADDNEYWIYRLMIDAAHQGKGYGKAAMQQIFAILREDAEHTVVYLGVKRDNLAATAFYESLGFAPDGRVYGSEIVYRRSTNECI